MTARRLFRTRGKKGAPRPCLVCGVVTPYSFCEEHAVQKAISQVQIKRNDHKAKLWRAKRLRATHGRCENNCGWVDPTGKTLELDHITPLESGGDDDYRNVWLLCIDCHKEKTATEQSRPKFPTSARSKNPMQN